MLVRIGRGIWWIGIALAIFLTGVVFEPVVSALSKNPFGYINWPNFWFELLVVFAVLGMTRLARYILANE